MKAQNAWVHTHKHTRPHRGTIIPEKEQLRKLSARWKNAGFQIEFGSIRGINVNAHTWQCRFQGFLATPVEHFVVNLEVGCLSSVLNSKSINP